MQKLNLKNLKELIYSKSPVDRSTIIEKCLKNIIIFYQESCYIVNDLIVYDEIKNYENKLLSMITKIVNNSYKAFDDSEKNELQNIKGYGSIFENSFVRSFLPQLIDNLELKDIKFDHYSNIIHFKNGYYDLEKKSFNKRQLGTHFITNCISYDYQQSKNETRQKVMKEIKKIYPKEDVMNAMLTIIGSALTGLATRDSYLLFLIGNASAGKSTILDLTKSVIECYLKQIKPDTFVEGKNTDKIINTYHKAPYIRVSWLNEPKDRKFDATFLKSFADGECNSERLYQEGSYDFKHFSLTIFSANNMPNIHVDGGVKRRIRALEHKSKFVDNKKDVNETNNVFLKDPDFKRNFDMSSELKLAFFDILATYANKWLTTNKKVILPAEFDEATNDIIDSNDHIQDFVDGQLLFTKDKTDKISKGMMLDLFNKIYPNKHLTVTQLVTLLKEKGVKYDRLLRSKGIQGSFYNIRLKNEINEDDYNYGVNKTDQSVKLDSFSTYELMLHYKKLANEYQQKWINELPKSLDDIKPDPVVKPKVTKVTKTTVTKITKDYFCEPVDEKPKELSKVIQSINVEKQNVNQFCDSFF